jgi:hypothetical protein
MRCRWPSCRRRCCVIQTHKPRHVVVCAVALPSPSLPRASTWTPETRPPSKHVEAFTEAQINSFSTSSSNKLRAADAAAIVRARVCAYVHHAASRRVRQKGARDDADSPEPRQRAAARPTLVTKTPSSANRGGARTGTVASQNCQNWRLRNLNPAAVLRMQSCRPLRCQWASRLADAARRKSAGAPPPSGDPVGKSPCQWKSARARFIPARP